MKQEYMQVSAAHLHFLVSIERLGGILSSEGEKKEGGIPVYGLITICNLKESRNAERFILLFSDENFQIGISVPQVEGLLEVEEEQIHVIPPEALWEKNNYLLGAIRLETLSPPLAYVLNLGKIWEKRTTLEPDFYL